VLDLPAVEDRAWDGASRAAPEGREHLRGLRRRIPGHPPGALVLEFVPGEGTPRRLAGR